MICFNELGKRGRLGNQLFQIASTIGIAKRNKTDYIFNDWEYAKYFEPQMPIFEVFGHEHKEMMFSYYEFETAENVILKGYYQSPKYWKGYEAEIRRQFEFTDETRIKANNAYPPTVFENGKELQIAIHIRRGDHYQNPNYHQIPISYYVTALVNHFPDFQNRQILIFTDDVEFCKVHFDCLPNAKVIEGLTDIESLCLMSMCDDFIIGHSTFGWWGAYLANRGKVIRPDKIFEGELKRRNPIETDFWPETWIEHKTDTKLDLKDCTFTIPLFYDSPDRQENVNLSIDLIKRNCDTNFIIGEQGSNHFGYLSEHGKYVKFDYQVFHRTKMLNEIAMMAETPFVANWDCDVIVTPMQLALTAHALRNGFDIVYPYQGIFHHVPRYPYYGMINEAKDIGVVKNATFPPKNGRGQLRTQHSGGAVFVNKEYFIESGMENENYISFSADDASRQERWLKIGAKMTRIKGAMWHINHWCGVNSRTVNPYWYAGNIEIAKERAMSKEEHLAYIETWEWVKKYKEQYATKLQKIN